MHKLPQNVLKVIKQAVDAQLEIMPKPRRTSVIAVAKSHISGEARERKSLDMARSELGSAINKSQNKSL